MGLNRNDAVIRIVSLLIVLSMITEFTVRQAYAAPLLMPDQKQEEAALDENSCVITYDANGGGFFLNPDTGSDENLPDSETPFIPEGGDQICSEIVGQDTLLFNRCPVNLTACEGQRFLGWSTSRDGSRIIPDEGIAAEGDITLYAIWESVQSGASGPGTVNDSGKNTVGDTPEEWEKPEGDEKSAEETTSGAEYAAEAEIPFGIEYPTEGITSGAEYAAEAEIPLGIEYPAEGMTSGAEYAAETEIPLGIEYPAEGMTSGAEYAAEAEIPLGMEYPAEGMTSGAEYAAETEIPLGMEYLAKGATSGAEYAAEVEIPEGSEEKSEAVSESAANAAANAAAGAAANTAGTDDTKTDTGRKTAPAEEEKELTGDAITGTSLSVQAKRRFARVTVHLSRTTFVYNGTPRRPSVTVRYGRTILRKGADYVMAYGRNVNAGRAVVKLVGRGKYAGVVKRDFRIVRAAQKMTVTAPAKLAVGRKTRLKVGGVRETRKYYFKTSNSGLAEAASNGRVTARKVGTARITISTAATRNFRAAKRTVSIRIVPGAPRSFRIKNLTKGFRLTWTKVPGATGYILYRNGKKIKTINRGGTTSYKDTAADCNGRKYLYKIIAKASTGTSTLPKTVTGYRGISYTTTSGKKIRYCFEQSYVIRTLKNSARNDLAVIDMDGVKQSSIREAAKRGVQIYGYLNAGALEHTRSYYSDFKHLRLEEYEGWDGEYWVDVTGKGWYSHLIHEAKKMKKAGAVGVYLDNTDIYYMVKREFDDDDPDLLRSVPSAGRVYSVLKKAVNTIENEVGLVVMPNGGDHFVKKFVNDCPGVIKVVNQEGVLYMNNKKQSSGEKKYRTDYLDWCKNKGIFVRGIEYTNSSSAASEVRRYYRQHGWLGAYISRHKNLLGD